MATSISEYGWALVVAASLACSPLAAAAASSSASGASANVATSTCGASPAIKQAEAHFDHATGILDNGWGTIHPLGVQSCLQNLLNFGYGLGLSSLSVKGIMQSLENKVCSTALNQKYKLIGKMNETLGTSVNQWANGYFTTNVNGTGHTNHTSYNLNDQTANNIWNALN